LYPLQLAIELPAGPLQFLTVLGQPRARLSQALALLFK
jgi:hypothetical protein